MTSKMQMKDHVAMGDLWDMIAYRHEFSAASHIFLQHGIEGPTPSGLTPIDAAIQAIGFRGNEEILVRALGFICWAFEQGALPRVSYLCGAVELGRESEDYTPSAWTRNQRGQGKKDFIDIAVLTVIKTLVGFDIPIEYQVIPPPDQYHADLNKRDGGLSYRLYSDEGNSPLHYAAQIGSPVVVATLLEQFNASVDKRNTHGATPLLFACLYGRIEAARLLLEHGADSTATNVDGRNALSLVEGGEDSLSNQIQDLLKLRKRYPSGPLIGAKGSYRNDGRIHRTARGDLVRSKSEVIIADALFYLGLDYRYEETLVDDRGGKVMPDFLIETLRGPCVWEHAGMMGDSAYLKRWETKLDWYETNGYRRGIDLFVTMEDTTSGIDSQEVRAIALQLLAFRA